MRIALDATRLSRRPSGARQRFEGIYARLIRSHPEFEFIVYESFDNAARNWLPSCGNVEYRKTRVNADGGLQKYLQTLKYWTLENKKESFDIFEWFNFPIFSTGANRTLFTIHDARAICFDQKSIAGFSKTVLLKKAASESDRIITVSQTMKSELMSIFPNVDISVIYNGIDINIFDSIMDEDIAACANKYAIDGSFILSVGHFEKRKNYINLIDAMRILNKSKTNIKLVIAGNDNGGLNSVVEKIRQHNIENQIIIVQGASNVEVRCLYKMCSLFVFPSIYEGFGIPILEAMAARRPSVLSDIPVFRELASDAGAYFSPKEPESMAFAIENLLSSPTRVDEIVRLGERRVLDFSFDAIVESYAQLYKDVNTRS